MIYESTSHLDPFNEHRVVTALAPLKLTRIQVAHRRETIAGAERVIALGESIDARIHKFPGETSPGTTTETPV